jgi:hypothetical protein
MIGECYVLQQEMNIRENVCWELGDDILSPDEYSTCFRAAKARVPRGTLIHIKDVRRQGWGSAGYCPQIVVEVQGLPMREREIFLPLCHSRNKISWLTEPLWREGDTLEFKPQYILRCEKG